jgi:hypothetical protein
VRVSLPDTLDNTYQNSSADLAFTFVAEQDPTDPHR